MGVCFSKNTKFDNIEYNHTVEFVPPIDYGKVVKVYDGDTITVAARLPYSASHVYRFHIRLSGIDTPEIKGKSEAEKVIAAKARDALHELVYGKLVIVSNRKTEKYGRILADIWLGNIHVNQWLLDKGYAVKYDGGTKHKWEM